MKLRRFIWYWARFSIFGILTIPLHYMHPKNRLEQLSNPILVTLIYLVLGFFFNLWHPGWLVFLAIPLGAIANH